MKIIHVSDLHLMKTGEKVWGFDPEARLDACLADIARHHGDAAFCVMSGDLTDLGEVEAYLILKERLARFPLETHLLVGNHDNRANYLSVLPARRTTRTASCNTTSRVTAFRSSSSTR